MQNSNYDLKNILNKININIDKKNQILIEKVLIHTKEKSLDIILRSDEILNYRIINDIRGAIKTKLKRYNEIQIHIKYSSNINEIEDLITEYWPNILYLIKKEVPSSYGWVDLIKWKINKKDLVIILDSDMSLYSLKKKNFSNKLEKILRYEFEININVIIKVSSAKFINKHTHNKLKEKEEHKLVNNIKIKSENNTQVSNNKNIKSIKLNNSLIYGKNVSDDIINISDINTNSVSVTIEGEIFNINIKMIKGNKKLYIIDITDFSYSITVKIFGNKKQQSSLDNYLKNGTNIRVTGEVVYDSFIKELVIMGKGIKIIKKNNRNDIYSEKRVELHLHTQMSSMDGITSFSEMAKRAAKWGHKAIAITDHGVVQAFPEGMSAAQKYGIKVLYGVEGYIVNDTNPIVKNCKNQDVNCEYVVFDIETTGFSPVNDRIIEIGAVKIKNFKIIDKFSELINPEIKIPEKITKLTGISDSMIYDKPTIDIILNKFLNFIGESVLVAHNASFDMGFIYEKSEKLKRVVNNTVLDTLEFSRRILKEIKSHKLDKVCKHLGIELKNHHRAVDDSEATANIFLKLINLIETKSIKKLNDINSLIYDDDINYKSGETYHIVIFAKNYVGLKNLYKLVSESHIKYFYRKPRIPKSILSKYREGLIIGSACEAGELYRAIIRKKTNTDIKNIIDFYDYLEIQPLDNNKFLIDNGMAKNTSELKEINRKIVKLGKKYNKPVVATGDVHFLDENDSVYRKILMSGQGYSDAENQPPLYLRTTDEMMEEFKYLGEDLAKEVVIDNTNKIADSIECIIPIPDGTFPPKIDGSEEQLKELSYKKAKYIYGEPLPDIVKDRLDRELNSIIKNGYAVLYIIAHKLVKKSLEDGYLVGSRGSVGSSFVATMSDITEVNPLPPHYICPNCKNSEFITDGSFGSGVDMKDKKCPKCGQLYIKDGFDIPFEVFLGFEGDKEPDIDLNFASEEQTVAHKYTEELFGKGHVYRAGTIGTIAEKTAYGFVKKYYDEKEINLNKAEANRLVKGCTGVKRTSGQHPGGVMVVPSNKEIFDFSPIQYPANDKDSGVITTHFDYHSISGRILKLDILGHDTPTIIRMLEDLTGINAQEISLDDEKTMGIFISPEPLGVTKDDIVCETGTLGIPEFGTKFVRQMLVDTKPTTFSELVRISGLSHGTDVWLNNAQDLVRKGIAKLNKVISTRDDIMMYLIYNGLDKKRSFKIMEKVRKGKGLTEEEESYMRENKVPEWYIDSCKKIKYMFPKAHAVAYVTMSFRIAYFKVYYPKAFYSTYFTMKASDFDADLIVKGKTIVYNKIKELNDLGNNKTAKEKNLLTVLEVALEMYARGFKFDNVDLYTSHSDKFIIGKNGIIPPLKSLQGVGENAARNIAAERIKGRFISIEDLITRSKISKTVVEALENHGCLDGMSQSNQLSLF